MSIAMLIKCLKWFAFLLFFIVTSLVGYFSLKISFFDDETLPVNHGKVNAKLFYGQGEQLPLVVGFGGGEGGNSWASEYAINQRKMLEENGFAFLSIAYFGEAGIPENLDRIDIEAVHHAILNAADEPRINEKCIALIGVSRGSELALLLGSYYDDYSSVVGIVPGSSVFASITDLMNTSGFYFQGKALPFVPVPWSAVPDLAIGDLRAAFNIMMQDVEAMDKAAIRVENISGPILFMSSQYDEQWPSMEMSEKMVSRLENHGFEYPYRHIVLKGGHSAHFDSFDMVIRFLSVEFLSQPGCKN